MRIVLFSALLIGVLANHSVMAIGPSYDCSRTNTPLQAFICADTDLSKIDLIFVQPYYAMRQQVGPAGWQALKIEAIDIANNIASLCGMSDPAGRLPPDTVVLKTCLYAAYARQAAIWVARLSGPAAEEASRPIELHINLQRRLQLLGYIPSSETIDGIYGTGTRGAITTWQQATNRPASGLLSNADAAALAYQAQIAPPVPLPVQARFPMTRLADGRLQIQVSGSIVAGDATRFHYAISALSEPLLVVLNSPGGEVDNGLEIARMVNSRNFNTYAVGQCMSMCFVIFTAGHYKIFSPGTRIGVHSASMQSAENSSDKRETSESFVSTMLMVRWIQAFNTARPIPDTILGKLVAKSRNDIAILSPGDLLAMDSYMDPPGNGPAITAEIERKARNATSQQSGDLVTRWIDTYANDFSRGMPPIYCPANLPEAFLPCLEGARDYALAVGMPTIAAEATRYAETAPKIAPSTITKSATTSVPIVPSLSEIQSFDDLYAIGKSLTDEHPFLAVITVIAVCGFISVIANTARA